jgi:enamine deaminase RidA (YjgF/YER057c/UK114 family)
MAVPGVTPWTCNKGRTASFNRESYTNGETTGDDECFRDKRPQGDTMTGQTLPLRPRPILYVNQAGAGHAFLVISVPPGAGAREAAADGYAQMAEVLRGRRMEIVQERIFGSLSVEADVKAARREALQSRGIRADGAMTYLQGRPTWGEGLAGVIVHAVSGEKVSDILDGGVPCGRGWRADGMTFLILQNLRGLSGNPGADNTPSLQSERMIARAERILREHGASYGNTVRTWFYLSDILGWYGDFNGVRNAKYSEFGLMPRPGGRLQLPASTGIRAELPGGAACVLDLLAVVTPETRGPAVECLTNPRQQEAFRYGSAFSRSAVIHGAREDLIQVSGTAAIDENGRSLHAGDIRAQVRGTLDKLAALLELTEASLNDVSAATVFVKKGEDAEAARAVMAEDGLEHLPAVWVVADVCREELLFEIDAEAVVARRAVRAQ